jgi:hypothetical protein
VCGYIQGQQEPSKQDIDLAKRILIAGGKGLKRDKFPFEFYASIPLVKRERVIDWLNKVEGELKNI